MTKTYTTPSKVSIFKTLIALVLVTICYQKAAISQSTEISSEVKDLLEYYEKKIYFTENKGQWSPDIKYRADFPLGQAVATAEGMLVGTYDPAGVQARFEQGMREEEAIKNMVPFNETAVKVKGHGWMLRFLNHSPSMTIESKTKHKDVFNYFAADPSKSKTNAKNYQEVWYKNVYNNVDVRYYPSAEGSLEYDMVCKPGFNKDNIVLQFDGISKITKKNDGSLVLTTSVGDMTLPAPVSYQKINGQKKSVKSQYIVTGNNIVKFDIGAFDASQTLIIDPIALRWATWINSASTGDNHGHCIWVDPADGAIYVVARVVGTTNNITVGAFDESANGNLETIIGKYLEPTTVGGSGTRVWQTYIGGGSNDNPYAMEQGPDGNLYIAGYTNSSDFPLLGGPDFSGSSVDNRSQSNNNIFVMKINKTGTSIKSAVIGGSGSETAFDLRITASGDVVVCGSTASTNLATLHPGSGASNTNNGSNDVFLFKINQDLSAIQWIRNYGGSGNDQAMIMQLNTANGDIYVGGQTSSSNFPTTSARQSSKVGSTSGFLQKLKSNGNTAWSSYFNSSSSSTSTSILCMSFNTLNNKLYFGGVTSGLHSSNISSSEVYDNSHNGSNDLFVAVMDTNQTFNYSTYVGGSNNEVNMMGLNTDLNNDVYVFAYTNSTDFPTTSGALQTSNMGSNDKVFLKLSSDLSTLLSSTYYGGSADDYDPVGERGIKFSNCRIYTIVTARSNNIPLTQGALTTSKSSSTGIYEPGLVIWANPPDLANNTLSGNQVVCAGGTPTTITGSAPSYILPTISRNGTTSSYPSLGTDITYQWQLSTDSVNWSNISGATGQNLPGTLIGPLFQKTYFRRVIGGDACVIQGSSDQIITVNVFTISGTVTDASCAGSNNGSITATVVNGNPPYSYSWSNGATTQTISNLAPGNYTVSITDATSCNNSAQFTVSEPNSLSVNCTPAGTYCINNGGSISTSVSGGTSPYSYLWSNGATTSSISGLGAGTYSVTVTDAQGCTANCSITLGVPEATCSKTDALCFGQSSGTASVSVTGGTSPFTYLWSNGATSSSISGLAAGSYSVTVTASNGCTATCSVTIGQPSSSVSASCNKTDAGCFGASTGSVSVSASGGTAPYSYLWNNGNTNASVSNLPAGSYSVTVTDANGCTANCSATVGQPAAALSASCNKTDAGCFGASTGSVSVSASGGTAPYSYLWNNGNTNASVSNLPAGSYSVTVTDANGCTANCSAIVGQPSAELSGSVSSTTATCTQSNSTATASISGGTQPYSYAWSNGQTGSSATGYAAGNYSVQVTDANGCQLTLNFTVSKTNCPPNAVVDYETTLEDVPVTVVVVSNDTDIDGNIDPSTVTVTSNPTNGTVVVNPNGTITYTPFSHYVGSDSFIYNVCDDGTPLPALCDTAIVFITVTGIPTTIVDTIPEDSLITICMDDYVNLQGGISSISICGMPQNGTFTINGICATYTPTANWNGTDNMCIVSCNSAGVCDTTPITIVVIPVNDPPIAVVDYASTSEDVPVTITVVSNDSDIDGNIDPSTVTVTSNPSNGSVVVNPNGTITYTPFSHYVGSDSFIYNVCDDGTPLPALCDTAIVFITVTGVPTTIVDTIPEDSLITICMDQFVNLQGGISGISICGMPQNGTFTLNGICATYTPTANWNGTDNMCIISCNSAGVCDTTPITIVVIPVNDPPIAVVDYASTSEDVPVTITVVSNDSDIDGNIDPSTVTVTSNPSNGSVVVNPNGTITYTPFSHYVGSDSFIYNVCDDGTPLPALCDTAIVFITVTGIPTTIVDTIPEDSLITICMDDYVNLQGGISGISICGMPQNGTFTLNGICATYTPTANWNGIDNMCIVSCNSAGVCDTTPITIVVIPVNDPPIAVVDYASTQEDVPVTITVVSNDSDIDGNIDPSTVTVTSNPTNGTVVVNPNGTITYTPFSHYVGNDQFIYNVCDDGTPLPALCDTAIVFITVTGIPTTIVDTIPEDSLITICMDDYVNLQGGISGISICGMPQNGTFTLNGICATYTPTANWNGTDNMCIISCNSAGVCDTTPITIVVIPVNDPPIAVDDSTTTNEDTPVTVVVVTNDSDIDGNIDPNTVTIITPPVNGTAVVNPDGSITYTPDSHYYGPDSLVYQVCDDGTPLPALCDQATVYINVIPVNLPPVAIDDINNTLENTPVSGNVMTNDNDPDGDNIIVTSNTNPSNGTVVVNPDGSYTYTPNTGYTGEDSFTYTICDDGVPGPLCDTATVFIEVVPVTVNNNPPIANHDEAVTLVNVPVGGNVLINDADPDGDNIILNTTTISGPSHGSVVLNPDGTFLYTPDQDYVGTDQFVYEICDDGVPSLCDQTTVCITILDNPNGPDNDPPFAADDAYLTPVNVAVGGDLLENDFDPNGDPITINTTPVSGTQNGTVVINPDGTFLYTPNPGYIGPDQFVYQICDNGGQSGQVLCAEGTAYITVYPVNNPPLAIDDINNTLVNTPVSGNVLTNDGDPDGDNITVTSNTNPSNGSVTINPDGSYTYTPNTGFTGVDSFTYTICDDGVPGPLCDVATVTIHVIEVTSDNNPPVANPDNEVTLINVPVSGNVLVNDGDPDGNNITVTSNTQPSNGTVVVNPDGSYIYTPNTDFVGVDVFTYEICDDGSPSLCDQTTVTITVLDDPNGPDNDPPFAADDAYLTPVNTAVGGDLLANDFDPNGDPITINTTPVSGPQNGSVVINSDGTFTYTPNNNYIGPDQFVYEICDNGGQSGQVLCAQATAYITVYPTIDLTLDPTDASCYGYSDGSIDLTVIDGVAPYTYLWSNGATTEDLSGVPAGTYSVTVTDAFGLVVSGDATVGEPAEVTVSIDADGPTEFCDGGSMTLSAVPSENGTYLWSTGETTQSIVVSASGDYSVVLTNGDGCFGNSGDISVTVYDNPTPTVTPEGPTEFCNGNSVVLTASAAAQYVWSPGGETTQSITVTASGSYSVWVMDSNGCEGVSSPVDVVVNNNPDPVVDVNGPTTFCEGGSVTLFSSSQSGNVWSPNGETTSSIVVSAAGSYFVTVTDDNGCVGVSDPVDVTVNPNPTPEVTPDGPTEFCDGESVVLTSTAASMYVWSPNGETTQSITVTESGDYSVWVMDANGCEGVSAAVTVTVYENPTPTITPDGPTTFCDGESVTLTSSAAESYLWAPNGETTQSITVSASGTFTVIVTDANGCRGTSAPVDVVVNSNPEPEVTADGPTTFCEGESVTLTSSEVDGNVWSPNGETTQSIVVTSAGSYYVTVTDQNGCVGISNPVDVFVNPNPTPTVSADGPTTFCEGETVTLTASAASSYVWSPGGQLTQSITVSASGDYSVWVMDQNGCEGTSAPVTVTVNSNPTPIVSANGPTEFCEGESVTLTANGNNIAGYVWSPNGETTQSITVSSAGSYSVTVTDNNGCVGQSNPVDVVVNPNPVPEISADGPLTFCEGGSVTLSSSDAASYVWSPNGETTQTIVVSASGSYTVAVIDANGCSGVSAAVDVTVNSNPVPVITADGPTQFCQGGNVTLTSSAADMYVWTPGGETTQSITVSESGDYSVWVMDANGCEGTSAPVSVVVNSNPTPVVDIDGPTTFCEGESVTLISSSQSGNVWSPNGETTQSITVEAAGSYYVTVTDVNGCVGVSEPVDITVNPNPTPEVTPDGPTEFCEGGSVTLTASEATAYLWAPGGATTQSITVSSSGSYIVTVYDENGCRGTSAPVDVVVNNLPVPTITPDGPTQFCDGGSVVLTASQAENYLWSPNGETTQSITVTESGSYSVTVNNVNGCEGTSAPIQVTEFAPVVVTVTANGPTEICEGESVTLTASSPNAVTYQWYQNGVAITGATGPSITVSDFANYHVVVTNQAGCSGNSPVVLVKVGEIPDAYAGADEVICPGESVTLTATGGEYFLWSNGETTQSITVSPEEATDYIVSVSNPFCDQVAVDTVNVSISELPIAAIHASDDPSLGNPVNFTDVSGDNSIVSWFWSFGDGTSASTQNTHHTYDTEGTFTVILTVQNQYGCSAMDTVEVDVKQIIIIPNVITPNNDGFNDALGVKNNGVDDYGITIFNRWGQIVYEREAREINWDGTTNSGVKLEAGTYFYILKVKNSKGSQGDFEKTGFITLIR